VRVLFDENIYPGFRRWLVGHEIETVLHLGWDGLKNGALLAKAIANGFDVLITLDQSIPQQNYLANKRIALVTLRLDTRTKATYLRAVDPVLAVLTDIKPGQIVEVEVQR